MATFSFQSRHGVPTWLLGTSLGLSLVLVAEVGVRLLGLADWTKESSLVFSGEFLVGVITAAPFVAGVAYAGHWLTHSELQPERFARAWWWTVAGAGAAVLLNLALMTVLPVSSVLLFVAWLRWAVALGAGLGVFIGVVEARAIQNATDAERSAVRAEHLEAQRDLLDYLNSLLRHEVLNATNVVSGYATLLKDAHDEGTPEYDYGDTILRRSEEITGVIEDVRVLLLASETDAPVVPVDLSETLAEEVAKLEDLDDSVEVEMSVPDSVYVRADALLPRVFGNLLANAVEHNDSSPPRVSVTVDAGGERVTVEIADNGSGVPDGEVEGLFDRPSQRTADHGFGTYLTAKLVEQYGGSVDLVETGPAGSTFRVALQRASPSSDGAGAPVESVSSLGTPVD
ncbi:sensor histidine kinase [Halobacterium wangiae]|uniref:sensor histidine kinase n=1 Tax=Halobacterium wangiae TaxID=2902623 RepID=UPI001E460DCF|nr:HAMP domain-containing sensor histidine kinase [Halobacterium wangiae]